MSRGGVKPLLVAYVISLKNSCSGTYDPIPDYIHGQIQRGGGVWTPLESHKLRNTCMDPLGSNWSLKNTGTDTPPPPPPKKQLDPLDPIASRGRSVQPSLKYFDD